MGLEYQDINAPEAMEELKSEIGKLEDENFRARLEDEEKIAEKKMEALKKERDYYKKSISLAEKMQLATLEKVLQAREAADDSAINAMEKLYSIKEKKEADFQNKFAEMAARNGMGELLIQRNEILKTVEIEHLKNRQKILQNNELDKRTKAKDLKNEEKKYKEKRKKKLADQKEDYKKLEKFESDERKKQAVKERKERVNNIKSAMKNEGIVGGVKKIFERDEQGNSHALENIVGFLGDAVKQLEKQVDEIGAKKGSIDTRLQGSKNNTFMGSYWDQISKDISGVAMISPLVKQSAIIDNISKMVDKGIAYNVEQRAFLATIKDKIATTFNAFDGTLLRLIRIQQQDSTAARLGMESALTAFLNNMYETTEYLSDVASSVRTQLEQAEALMSASGATAFEYQVQKWLGSMYSTGMSNSTVGSIASALGKLASGDISDFNGSGVGNLVIMAANNANLSISDLLAKGLDESSTNQLMQAMVNYLASLYGASKDNLVVQQQLAKVYGMTAADLKAATNIADKTSISNIYSNYLGYGEALNQLSSMANSMYSRTSVGELIGNTWDNFKYTMAAGIANNPITYSIFKGANLIDGLLGGAEFSIPLVFGSGTAQTFNVADIMRIGALGNSIFSAIGSLGNIGTGFSGDAMLKALNIDKGTTVQRGNGQVGSTVRGITTSASGYAGNSEGGDIYNKYVGDTTSEQNQKVQAAQDSTDEITIKIVNENILNIYRLLQSVTDGSAAFTVVQKEYGLSGWN